MLQPRADRKHLSEADGRRRGAACCSLILFPTPGRWPGSGCWPQQSGERRQSRGLWPCRPSRGMPPLRLSPVRRGREPPRASLGFAIPPRHGSFEPLQWASVGLYPRAAWASGSGEPRRFCRVKPHQFVPSTLYPLPSTGEWLPNRCPFGSGWKYCPGCDGLPMAGPPKVPLLLD